MLERLKSTTKTLKREVQVYRLVIKDKRTPWVARILFGAAVGYALLPFDLIPDFIPVIGHLDDVIILPILVFAALKITPQDVIDDCRKKVVNKISK